MATSIAALNALSQAARHLRWSEHYQAATLGITPATQRSEKGSSIGMARILVVDDEADERFLAGRTLEKHGHEVVVAGDGAAGLEAVRTWSPDLVVTDLMMPVMDGAEFIRRLRGDPATAGIPILAASANTEVAGAADAVLQKPYDKHQLIMIISTLLTKGRNGH
jgi:CheY-like chemotaxis protein